MSISNLHDELSPAELPENVIDGLGTSCHFSFGGARFCISDIQFDFGDSGHLRYYCGHLLCIVLNERYTAKLIKLIHGFNRKKWKKN